MNLRQIKREAFGPEFFVVWYTNSEKREAVCEFMLCLN